MMNVTHGLEQINKKIEQAETQCDIAKEIYENCKIRCEELVKLRKQFIFTHQLYRPMSDLKQYKNAKLKRIVLVHKLTDGTLDDFELSGNGLRISETGFISLNDDIVGVFEHLKDNTYIFKTCHACEIIKCVGFTDICVKQEC